MGPSSVGVRDIIREMNPFSRVRRQSAQNANILVALVLSSVHFLLYHYSADIGPNSATYIFAALLPKV